MYDPRVTNRQIETAARAINKDLAERGQPAAFTPERHSANQIRRNNDHLHALINPDTGELSRELAPDEALWIRNERLLCTWDFRYLATNYDKILDWTGDLALFKPNIAQEITLDVWAETESDGRAIVMADLKARQLGDSTITELAVAQRVQFHPNVNALVASSRPEKSAKMAEMMERAWANMPWFLMPRRTRYNVGELIEFSNNSCVSIQHGAQFSGVARGDTPTVCHVSEIADWLNPKQDIDAALLRAMHESPWLFLVIEGTGMGKHNWWHETWKHAKANWKDGRSRLRPKFLPWFIGTDIYPTKAWLRSRPIPRDWRPEPETIQHANKAREYVQANDLLRKYLGTGWEMPPDQMWFWESTKAEYKAKRALAQFYQELAADDLEAFQSPNPTVFDAELILHYQNAANKPPMIYALRAPTALMDPKFLPAKHMLDKTRSEIQIAQELTLVPIKFQSMDDDPCGKIFIWEFPEPNEEYGLGVDSSNGVGQDRSVIEGIRKGNMRRNDAQICEFASPWVNAMQLLPWVLALGQWYSVPVNGTVKQAKQVIELAAGGNLLQNELRMKYGWRNFHVWMRAYDQKVLNRARSNVIGWSTVHWAREGLIATLMEYLSAAWIDINSPWFVDELSDLESDENSQKIAAARGAHDDRVMALAMVLFSLHDIERNSRTPVVARERQQAHAESEQPAVWTPPDQARSILPAHSAPIWTPQMLEDYEPEEESLYVGR